MYLCILNKAFCCRHLFALLPPTISGKNSGIQCRCEIAFMPEDRSTNKLPLNTDSVAFCFCMTSRHLWKSARGVWQLFGNILSPWRNCSLCRDWLSLGCLFLQVKTCYIENIVSCNLPCTSRQVLGVFFGCSLPIYSEVIKGKLYIASQVC